MNSFALIGASGFVARRHMDAIKKCGGNLICTFDPHDNIGFIDNYFPEAFFLNRGKAASWTARFSLCIIGISMKCLM